MPHDEGAGGLFSTLPRIATGRPGDGWSGISALFSSSCPTVRQLGDGSAVAQATLGRPATSTTADFRTVTRQRPYLAERLGVDDGPSVRRGPTAG